MKYTPITAALNPLPNNLKSAAASVQAAKVAAKRLELERANLKEALEEMVDLYGMHVNATIIKSRLALANLDS